MSLTPGKSWCQHHCHWRPHCCQLDSHICQNNQNDCQESRKTWSGVHWAWGGSWWWRLLSKLPVEKLPYCLIFWMAPISVILCVFLCIEVPSSIEYIYDKFTHLDWIGQYKVSSSIYKKTIAEGIYWVGGRRIALAVGGSFSWDQLVKGGAS